MQADKSADRSNVCTPRAAGPLAGRYCPYSGSDDPRIEYASVNGALSGWLRPRLHDTHPHLWGGIETLIGQCGNRFTRASLFVIDDFGNLVAVPA